MDKLIFIFDEIKYNEDKLRQLEEHIEQLRVKIATFKDILTELQQPIKHEEKTNGLGIIAWNIKNYRAKLEDETVLNYLMKFDIVCLTESMSKEDKSPKLEGFKTYNNPRDRANRVSGGISVLIKEQIEVQELDGFRTEDVSWLLIKHVGLSFVLGIVYNPPSGSQYHNPHFFSDISEKINIIREEYKSMEIVLTGDFNARTDGANGRQSQDKVINNQGKLLNTFCNNENFKIINGTTPGDSEGSFTYVPKSTVVDYVLLQKSTDWKYDLKVDSARTESDHKPLLFKFQPPPAKINAKSRDQVTSSDEVDELSTDIENITDGVTKKIKFEEE